MARPEYKATVKAERLHRGIRVDENLSISLWFNVQDPELKAQLDNYYNTNKDDWKKQPSLELQVKIGDTYHKVCSSTLFINDGAGPASVSPPPAAPAAPAPIAPAPPAPISEPPYEQ